MNDAAVLSADEISRIVQRYSVYRKNRPDLIHGTVRDFCDSWDHLRFLAVIQGDLKDFQRPSTFKGILGLVSPGASLLEIGAGEPHVADALCQLGYNVTVVDPYDGSGHGPTQVDEYRHKYPQVKITQDLFSESLVGIEENSFDCIYSISVLEHVHQPALTGVFRGIKRFLRPGGHSLHLVDHVLAGNAAEFHTQQLAELVMLQAELADANLAASAAMLTTALNDAAGDLDTYVLSAESHNRWRGTTAYEEFPYRKVISMECYSRKA